MPERAVKLPLPTPEQERQAVLAFIAFSILTLIGAGALLFAIALGIGTIAKWVFS